MTDAKINKFRDPNQAPLRKLTVDLINSYNIINKVYYLSKKSNSAREEHIQVYNDGFDDESFDLKIIEGDVFVNRFVIERLLGKGSFGQVVKAFDRHTEQYVAIKIIKSKKSFLVQSKSEVAILDQVNRFDPHDQFNLVRMKDQFIFRNHQCIVFELLSYNLYDLIRNTNFRGVSLNLTRKIARQILTSLAFLSLPDINVIHCDLKPENILLRHPKHSAVKIIDFGSSCRQNEIVYSYIQSRFYRSPEVLLRLPYNSAVDMWSLGCILVELHTGEPLFSGGDEPDLLGKMVEVLGLPPDEMIVAGTKHRRFFEQFEDTWKLRRSGKHEYIPKSRPMARILGVDIGGPEGRRRGQPGHNINDYLTFMDLLAGMLDYDPRTRLRPVQALQHPFFHQVDEAHDSQHVRSGRQFTTVPGTESHCALAA
mmetsp:Transcript_46346/g.75643  ORF Transcript_46346/g.75643 Transcript_46346/m.75643 type:complete len:424 (-) Transcript_46346:809-2080(-)|eukprot:CAMPEP_0184644172 /NCGR_PEP_ID=MMETSP0308-20130426/934_1 /TAXON_ID=38269 /ORGANISM="Gloeochaete witrockiana, Strain SAG 46.84" /LENGTH=423 /DNA_ID=CAMNT_0027072559 /DNA_START=310 /DNA_END=1581 /DNA_ORIENTATION=+